MEENEELNLLDMWNVVRKYKYLVIIFTVGFALVGTLYSYKTKKNSYTASASLNVLEYSNFCDYAPEFKNKDLIDKKIKESGYTGTYDNVAHVYTVSCTASDPDTAIDKANKTASEMVEYIKDYNAEFLTGREEKLNFDIKEQSELIDRIKDLSGQEQYSQEVVKYYQLERDLNRIEILTDKEFVSVEEEAADAVCTKPGRLKSILLVAVAGCVIGLFIAFFANMVKKAKARARQN